MRIGGLFNGTSAEVTICIGFVPDYVNLWNLTNGTLYSVEWTKGMSRAALPVEGIEYNTADQVVDALTLGDGVVAYHGGVLLTSSTAGTTTYGNGVFLKQDYFDYSRLADSAAGIIGGASEEDIDTWTLDTAGSNTGKFNGGVTASSYIGTGSSIIIDGRAYTVVALTTDGSDDDEVTLNLPAPSGTIEAIYGRFDYSPMVGGEYTPAGFTLSDETLNVNNELIAFEAGKYDR